MGKPIDIEDLKAVLRDPRTHIAIGTVAGMKVAADRSFLSVDVSVFPEQRVIAARMSWDAVGPESGIYQFPVVGDLVLVAMPEGNDDLAHVIKRMSSKTDKIPLNALSGDLVLKALAGKVAWLTASRVNISQGDDEPTEPLMLGDITASLLSDILALLIDLSNKLATHTHVTSAPGSPTSVPIQATDFSDIGSDFDNIKSSPVDDGAILSDFAFTEKGS